MAKFNPTVAPTNDPNWTQVTKPISDLTPDRSAAIAMNTTAEGITGAVNLADQTTKAVINEDIDTGVNKLREDTINVYQVARAQQQQGNNTQAAAIVGSPSGTLAEDSVSVPSGLKNGLQTLDGIGQAAAQNGGGGKANDTLYTAAAYAQLKQLRNQYPGYKDYIDEQYKKQSGIDPANAYMSNLLQDINRNAVGNKSETDKAIALGRQYLGYDDHMPAYIEAVRQNLPGAIQNLENRINSVAGTDVKQKRWEQQRAQTNASKEDDAKDAQVGLGQLVEAKAFNQFNTVISIPGLDNAAKIQDILDKQRNGEISLSPEQNNQLLSVATAARDAAYREAQKVANDPKTGFSSRINDPKKEKEIIANKLAPYDQMVEAIANQNYGTLFETQRRVKALNDGTEEQMLTEPGNLGRFMKNSAVAKKYLGDNWNGIVLSGGLQAEVAKEYRDFTMDARMRSQLPDDLRKDGVVKSLYSDIVKAQKGGAGPETKVYDNLIDNVNTIADPRAPVQAKSEVVKYAFNPRNWKIMDRFQKDFVDDNGVTHKGRNSIYDLMSSPKITDNVWNLKDREAWDNYKNWNEQSFKTIYAGEIKEMNSIQEDASMPVKVAWDADNRRFSLSYPKPKTDIEANYIRNNEAIVSRLNAGLYNMARVNDKEGTDTSAYLLRTLTTIGYRPNEKVSGLPQKMMDAIANSKRTNRIEDAFKAAQ